MTDPGQPLSGIRVLDLSRLIPGPFCSLLLAELGAEVIKIEDPNGGDYLRWFPPQAGHSGAQFIALNRGKRSVALDLKQEAGRALFRRLVAGADIVLESFRPGVLDRLGVGFSALSEEHPRLIGCAITGYGQDGPYQRRAGHDVDYLAIGGVLGLMGLPPRVLPIQVADIAGGALFAAVGILSALFARERKGKGRILDISMTEGSLAFLTAAFAQSWGEGRPLLPGGELLTGAAPGYALYETRDKGSLAVGALEPKFFSAFIDVIGRPDLKESGLSLNDPAVTGEIAKEIRQKTRAEWEEIFAGHDACVEPVLGIDELARHPQHIARGAIEEAPEGPPVLKSPIHRLNPHPPRPAPALGEHTREVLREAGVEEEEIVRLLAKGVLGESSA